MPQPQTRLVVQFDSAGDTVDIKLNSINPSGVTSHEKVMAQRIIEALGKNRKFPKIDSWSVGGGRG